MKVSFKKAFFKDLKKAPKRVRFEIIKLAELFSETKKMKDLEIDIKKLQGYENYFRVRIGVWRVGLKIDKNQCVFCRIKHRREIYRLFP